MSKSAQRTVDNLVVMVFIAAVVAVVAYREASANHATAHAWDSVLDASDGMMQDAKAKPPRR